MKKKLTLKLVETNDTPRMGDLVNTIYGLKIITKELETLGWWQSDGQYFYISTSNDKIVKPYGVSDDEIKIGDTVIYYDVSTNKPYAIEVYDEEEDLSDVRHSKVEILPEQFNYQDIIDLGLSDGSEFEVEMIRQDQNPYYRAGGGPVDDTPIIRLTPNDKVSISIPLAKEGRLTHQYFEDKYGDKITYTEEEVESLFYDLGTHIEKEFRFGRTSSAWRSNIIKWFKKNKKKE